MDLRLFRYFVAVAEEQHFGRAAERLGITPPTLTVQIQTLERALGTPLLIRDGKKVSMSSAGQRFLVEARATLKQADKAERIAREVARGEIATVTVSTLMSAAMSGIVSEVIGAFAQRHPGVSFRLQRMETISTLKALVERNVDVGFTRPPVRYPPELAGFTITRSNLWVALPATHALAKAKSVELEDLAGIPYLPPALEIEIGFRGNIAGISPSALPAVSEAPAGDVVSAIVLVGAGLGITIVSEPVTRIAVPNVVFRPIRGLKTKAEHVVVYRKTEDSTAVMQFIDLVREYAPKT